MIKVLIMNKDIKGHLKGSKVKIKCDGNGIPLDIFWRRRLRDSAVDNCVELVKENKIAEKLTENKLSFSKGDKS